MTVIEKTKEIISQYNGLSDFLGKISIDFMDNTSDNCGLNPTGDQKTGGDILGNEKRRHSFILYTCHQSITDFDKLSNSEFLLNLGYYLEKQKDIAIDNGKITAISCANGMAFSAPGENLQDITYQLQIYTDYTKEVD